jgi:VPDSG-CTERM motif
MKEIFITPASRNSAMRIPMVLGFAFALTFLHLNASALEISPGTDNYDAILVGSTITGGAPILINGGLGLTPDSAVTGGPLVNELYDFDDARALLALNDFTTPELFWTTTPLRYHYPEGRGSSVPDTGSTLLLLAFALAAIFAFKRPFSGLPGKA